MDGLSGRRRSSRQPVVLAASALAIDCSRSGVIADLSENGARFQGRGLPGPGREILLTVGSKEVFGTVAWHEHEECGVTFDPPLPAAIVESLKKEGRWSYVMGVEQA